MFVLTASQTRVLSALFTDLAAGWILSAVTVRQPLLLTGNIVGAIVSLWIAMKLAERNRRHE